MKALLLIFCLLLLGLGTLSLVLLSFLNLSFNWDDFIIYLVLGLIVYAIVWFVGFIYNRGFYESITAFLKGRDNSLSYDKKSLPGFGLLLVTLLPLLVYSLLLSLYTAITFAKYGMMAILYSPRIPIVIPIAFAIVIIGTAIGILSGFYNLFRPPQRSKFGIQITPNENRRLWSLIQETGTKLQAKPIDDVLVTPDPGIGVYLGGSVLGAIFGRGRQTLEIGIPSLHKLTVSEFGAILAHEYGHFSHRDTQWGAFTYSMGNALVSALRSTPGPQSFEGSGLLRIIVSLNPAFWLWRNFRDRGPGRRDYAGRGYTSEVVPADI